MEGRGADFSFEEGGEDWPVWSSDGRFLYAGGGYRAKGGLQIRKWVDGGRGGYSNLAVGVELSLMHILALEKAA